MANQYGTLWESVGKKNAPDKTRLETDNDIEAETLIVNAIVTEVTAEALIAIYIDRWRGADYWPNSCI